MITSFVVGVFLTIGQYIMSFFPTSTANYGFGSAYTALPQSTFFQYFGWANNYFPMSDVVNAILGLLALFLIMYVVRVMLWLLKVAHVIG